MISSDVIRGYNDLFILAVLQQGDSYGYEISKRIRETADNKYVMKETTLYSAITRLEKKDYLEAYPGDETFGKARTYYRVTAAGQDFFAVKKAEWELTREVVNKFVEETPNENH